LGNFKNWPKMVKKEAYAPKVNYFRKKHVRKEDCFKPKKETYNFVPYKKKGWDNSSDVGSHWYEQAHDKFEKLVKFHNKHKRSPRPDSKNKTERQLGQWARTMRAAKKGTMDINYPNWLDEEAKEHGVSHIFEINKHDKNNDKMFNKLLVFHMEHKRCPSSTSEDDKEVQLSKWLYRMIHHYRCRKPEKSRIIEKFKRHNLEHLLIGKREQVRRGIFQAMADFNKKHGRKPKQYTKDLNERKMQHKIYEYRKARLKGNTNKFTPWMEKFAKENGFLNWFE